MNWIPYVLMVGRAKENLPGGSLKYLFVYLKIRIFKCSYVCFCLKCLDSLPLGSCSKPLGEIIVANMGFELLLLQTAISPTLLFFILHR